MQEIFYIISLILIIISILPFSKNQHWVFRVPEFMKIQLLFLQLLLIGFGFWILEETTLFWAVTLIQTALAIYHLLILIKYTSLYKSNAESFGSQNKISIISSNVYQFNKKFHLFHKLINNYRPDIFITMESHSDWERANNVLEKDYPFHVKVTLENTYGMHLYSKIPIESSKVHFFVADDLPSIEAHFGSGNKRFCVFAVHPPPPSPTEETTSKERDGDLLSIAKRVKEIKSPTLVIGDFNTVAWSTASKLFRKTSELIDARLGRGILATFHAKYWFFRVPLDLMFHSPEIFIDELKTLENIGSDHFPIYCQFHVNLQDNQQQEEVKTLDTDEKQEVEQLIQEGINEESDNREAFAEE